MLYSGYEKINNSTVNFLNTIFSPALFYLILYLFRIIIKIYNCKNKTILLYKLIGQPLQLMK